MSAILEFLFGCTHHNLSRVFTGPRRRQRATKHWPKEIHIGRRDYKVCLDCGREFEYDWKSLGAIESGDGRNAAQVRIQEN